MIRILKILLSVYVLYALALLGAAALIIVVPKIPNGDIIGAELFLVAALFVVVSAVLATLFDQPRNRPSADFSRGAAQGVTAPTKMNKDQSGRLTFKGLLIVLPLLYAVHFVVIRVDAAQKREIYSAHSYSNAKTPEYPAPYDGSIARWRSKNFFVTYMDRAIHQFLRGLDFFIFTIGSIGALAVVIAQARRLFAQWRNAPAS